MKRILTIAFAVMAVSLLTDSSANAQITSSTGFQFGVGLSQAGVSPGISHHGHHGHQGQFGFGGIIGPRFSSVRREQPPYFAKFPPVYYSGIVRRPYGISPYAAPPGIAPVELSIPVPATVKNPFFDSNVSPVSETVDSDIESNETDDKTTLVLNPFVETLANN